MANFTEKVTIEVIADTKAASDDIGDVGDDLKELTDDPVEIKVETDKSLAERALLDVQDDIASLRDKYSPVNIDVKVDTATAHRQLKDVSDDAAKAGHEGGGRYGESFITDVGGVFGGGAATELGGTLAAGIETGFEALGLSPDLSNTLLKALGIGAVAITAGTLLWKALTGDADAYKKKVEEVKDAHKALAKGAVEDAATVVVNTYGKQIAAAQKYGFTVEQITRDITGQSDEVVQGFQKQIDKIKSTDEHHTNQGKHSINILEDQIQKIHEAENQWIDSGMAISENEDAIKRVGSQLDQLPETKTVKVDVPPPDLSAWYAVWNKMIRDFKNSGGDLRGSILGAGPQSASSSTQTTINNFPPTLSPVRVAGAAATANRRNGALRR